MILWQRCQSISEVRVRQDRGVPAKSVTRQVPRYFARAAAMAEAQAH